MPRGKQRTITVKLKPGISDEDYIRLANAINAVVIATPHLATVSHDGSVTNRALNDDVLDWAVWGATEAQSRSKTLRQEA